MALPSTRLEYRIKLSDADKGVSLSESLIVAHHPSESAEHVTLRVLAWCLLHEERIEFGPGLSDPDVADLWTRDLTGQLTTWIECGTADPDKLKKVLQHHSEAAVHAVFSEPRRRADLLAGIAAWKKPPRTKGGLSVWGIDRPMVQALAALEGRRHEWTVTIVEGHVYVDANGKSIDGDITILRPIEN